MQQSCTYFNNQLYAKKKKEKEKIERKSELCHVAEF